MSFSVAICSKNRDFYLNSTLSYCIKQSLIPKEIIVVNTSNKPNTKVSKEVFFCEQRKLNIITIMVGNDYSNVNISKSRNICLQICKSDRLIFVDDDVVLNFSVFYKLNLLKDKLPQLFAVTGKIIGFDQSIFSQYMTYFHNKIIEDSEKPQIIPTFGNTTILIDMKIQRRKNIFFDTRIDSGEDTVFYTTFSKEKFVILFYPKIFIYHDFFLGNHFNFYRRFYWYSKSLVKLNSINSDSYY